MPVHYLRLKDGHFISTTRWHCGAENSFYFQKLKRRKPVLSFFISICYSASLPVHSENTANKQVFLTSFQTHLTFLVHNLWIYRSLSFRL